MTLTRWNPFREMDELFGGHRAMMRPEWFEERAAEWRPAVDVVEDEGEYRIKAELPEVSKEDVSIQLDNGVLTLTGERRFENKDEKAHRVERFHGTFTRSFTVPDNVDAGAIRAEQKDGMLYIHLPKRETPVADTKDIEIH